MKTEEILSKYSTLQPYSEFFDIKNFLFSPSSEIDKLKESDELSRLFWSTELFGDLIEHKLLTTHHVKEMFDRIDDVNELKYFSKNAVLMRYALKKADLKLLDVADKYIELREIYKLKTEQYPSKYSLCSEDFFDYCLMTNLTDSEELLKIYNKLKDVDEWYVEDNMAFFAKLVKDKKIDEFEVIDNFNNANVIRYSNRSTTQNSSQLTEYLSWANRKIANNTLSPYSKDLLSHKALRYLFDQSAGVSACRMFSSHEIGLYMLKEKLISVRELVDKLVCTPKCYAAYKATSSLVEFLKNINGTFPWREFAEHQLLTNDDLSYIIKNCSYDNEFHHLCMNKHLLKMLAQNNLFDRSLIIKCQNVLKKLTSKFETFNDDLFDLLKKAGVQESDIQKVERNLYFKLTPEEQKKLFDLIECTQQMRDVEQEIDRANEAKLQLQNEIRRRQDIIQQLMEYGVSYDHTLETLTALLTKDSPEKKKKIKLNF